MRAGAVVYRDLAAYTKQRLDSNTNTLWVIQSGIVLYEGDYG